ncbi:MAG: putative quinol monooxygenase [Rehaibacterium terrae]|uniref:putative quinol monooxygenase n=1 Tax=Rehaibacterium terrae TaxID=1341696 RepID=UPI00391B305F
MFCYVWEYRVAPAHRDAFLAACGPDGDWVKLFARDPAWLGTELGVDLDDPLRFVTLDRWTSRAACLAFRERFRNEFDAIDRVRETLTAEERHLSDFERPERA